MWLWVSFYTKVVAFETMEAAHLTSWIERIFFGGKIDRIYDWILV